MSPLRPALIILSLATAGCSTIVGVDANSSPRSPVAGANEFTAGARELNAYNSARACVAAQGGVILADAPDFGAIHWYQTPGASFSWQNDAFVYTLAGLAVGRSITVATGDPDIATLEAHEVAHMLTGYTQDGHAGPFWLSCGWLRAMETAPVFDYAVSRRR